MKRISCLLLVLLLISISGRLAHAQERQLFERKASADLTPQQEKVLAHFRAQPTTQSIEIISVNQDVLKSDSQFAVKVTSENALKFQTVAKEVQTNQVIVSAKPAGDNSGLTMFDVQNGQVTGSIFTSSGVFRVQPLGGNLQALIKVDQSKFPKDHPPVSPGIQNQSNEDPSKNKDNALDALKLENKGGEHSLKILIAYTRDVAEKAEQGFINLSQLSRQAINLSNLSYSNSGVKIRMLAATDAPLKLTYKESGYYEKDLEALVSKNDGIMDEIHKARESRGANIVILLVANQDYCGLASDIPGSTSRAFAAVNYDCAIDNLSFPHEIGHLQGARHDLPNDPTLGYNHGFVNTVKKQRTIMAYPCAGDPCTRVPEWSRPLGWGSVNNENNARVLSETARMIEKWGIQGAVAANN